MKYYFMSFHSNERIEIIIVFRSFWKSVDSNCFKYWRGEEGAEMSIDVGKALHFGVSQ